MRQAQRAVGLHRRQDAGVQISLPSEEAELVGVQLAYNRWARRQALRQWLLS